MYSIYSLQFEVIIFLNVVLVIINVKANYNQRLRFVFPVASNCYSYNNVHLYLGTHKMFQGFLFEIIIYILMCLV